MVGEAERPGQTLLIGRERIADPDQTHLWHTGANRRRNAQQHVDALARRRAADVQDFHRARRGLHEPRGRAIGGGGGLHREHVVDAERRDHQPILPHEPTRNQLVPDGGGIARHAGGALQAGENPARHRLKRRRPSILDRRQHRPERVEIMTGDHRSLRRQRVCELRIAVIDDVKDVMIVHRPADAARIIPEPIQETIGVHGRPRATAHRHRHAREPPGKRRAQQRRRHGAGMRLLQVPVQHRGDPVHARPPLFTEIAADAHPDRPHRISSQKKSVCCLATIGQA